MLEDRHERGVLDTSVVIALGHVRAEDLPQVSAISALTLAELSAGPVATSDPVERARRQARLQWTEASFDALPFDDAAARSYGRVYASVASAGRKARGRRAVDLLIAATALAAGLPVYTCNPDDFAQIDDLEVVAVSPSA